MTFDKSLDPVGPAETCLLSVCVFTKVIPFSVLVSVSILDSDSLHSPGVSTPGLPDLQVTSLHNKASLAFAVWIPAAVLASPMVLFSRITVVEKRTIPDTHGWNTAVIGEYAEVTCAQQKVLACTRRQPKPARCEHAQNVSVREERDIATGGPRTREHAVHS